MRSAASCGCPEARFPSLWATATTGLRAECGQDQINPTATVSANTAMAMAAQITEGSARRCTLTR
ncbi:hypothetical protein RND64_19305 [Gordonia sp. w5E2]|uniref:hypothetical protein n=1 Tax=Gordonia TaxID=2053 RepID=UPI001364ACB3|nr:MULTISPECIES: hypothetical protein [Gordonia]